MANSATIEKCNLKRLEVYHTLLFCFVNKIVLIIIIYDTLQVDVRQQRYAVTLQRRIIFGALLHIRIFMKSNLHVAEKSLTFYNARK